MTFTDIEKVRKAKGLCNWQMAYLLGLKPKSRVKTSLPIYCGTEYTQLKNGRRNINLEIMIAVTALASLTPEEIKAKLPWTI